VFDIAETVISVARDAAIGSQAAMRGAPGRSCRRWRARRTFGCSLRRLMSGQRARSGLCWCLDRRIRPRLASTGRGPLVPSAGAEHRVDAGPDDRRGTVRV